MLTPGRGCPRRRSDRPTALEAAGRKAEVVEVAGSVHADWDDRREPILMPRYVRVIAKAFAA